MYYSTTTLQRCRCCNETFVLQYSSIISEHSIYSTNILLKAFTNQMIFVLEKLCCVDWSMRYHTSSCISVTLLWNEHINFNEQCVGEQKIWFGTTAVHAHAKNLGYHRVINRGYCRVSRMTHDSSQWESELLGYTASCLGFSIIPQIQVPKSGI